MQTAEAIVDSVCRGVQGIEVQQLCHCVVCFSLNDAATDVIRLNALVGHLVYHKR